MIETIVIGIISIFFAYLSRYKNLDWGLKVSFSLIFFFLAFRYDFGNDYQTYFLKFESISQLKEFSFDMLKDDFFEPGWLLINWLFRDIGFFSMTIVLAFFSSLVYYHFIAKYVPPKYYWLAVFFYVFDTNLLLVQSSAMRQSVAIILFLFSIDFLNEKKMIKYALCVIVASFFHFSAILLLAIYFLVFVNKRLDKISGTIIFAVYVFLIFGSKILSPYLIDFVAVFSEKYQSYKDEGVLSTGLGFAFYAVVLIILLYNEKKQDREIGFIFKLVIVSLLVLPLSLVLEMFGRFWIYFTPAIIVAYPNLISKINKPLHKIILCVILCTFTLLQFYQFFYSETYNEYFMDYKTIFSVQGWW